ncbi:MAG TPA: rod shape-determining protein MreD [Methylophilaceae bacterium]|nr:rod shape-determining protein MreD [Methylophilaceae bacterium]HQR61044.1 rod shape-determining protein MreD [Methylophilaceae bacterium]
MHPSHKHVYLSLFAAFILYLLPWQGFGLMLRPDFVLLVLIYWMLRAPHLCNVGTAWTIGLLVDLASGGLFGQYALAYAISAFVALTYQRRLVLFNAWQQAAYVLALLLLTQTTILVLKLFSGGGLPGWSYFLPSVSGVLLWQLLFSRIRAANVKDSG